MCSAWLLLAREKNVSPDGKLYAVEEKGGEFGKGREIERISVFTAEGTPVSTLHIWVTEPDGAGRTPIRGCESADWIDSRRFECQGTINPSTEIYRWFDARTGKEPGEAVGSQFEWSPDGTKLANLGNTPHFTPDEDKTESLDVDGHNWPEEGTGEQHWFRSDFSWSPDSRAVGVVDHRRGKKKGFYLVVVDATTGKAAEHRLLWPEEADEWPPSHNFEIEWTADRVTVRRADLRQVFSR